MTPVDHWATVLQATGASAATIQIRTKTIRAVMRMAGKTDPLDISRLDVVAFLGRPLKPWSKLTYWRSINAWSRFLTEWDHPAAETDLLKGIPKPKSPPPAARPIDEDIIDKMLRLDLGYRPRAYVRLALFAGLRVHEIAKVAAEDFDFTANWLTVVGKGGYTEVVPIHPEIRRLAETMPEVGWWFPSPFNPEDHVVPAAVSNTIRNVLVSVGSRATAHQLRDTGATKIQRGKGDIRITQSFLRHHSVGSTQKYTKVADTDLQEAVLALDWTSGPQLRAA